MLQVTQLVQVISVDFTMLFLFQRFDSAFNFYYKNTFLDFVWTSIS